MLKLTSAILARRTEARHAVRVMVAVLVAQVVTGWLHLPQGYWAVFTTLIVMQGSVGGTVGASIDRLYGTALGAAIGAAAAGLRPPTPVGLASALVIACGLCAFIAALWPRLRVATVTAAILLLTSAGRLGPLQAALDRVIEIGLGGVVGVLASLLIFPVRSHGVIVARIAAALTLIDALLARQADRLQGAGETDASALHDRLRGALAAVETAMSDAERERASRLGAHRIAATTPRTLWRLRSDAVSIQRALATPWPDRLHGQLGAAASDMIRSDRTLLAACRTALETDRKVDRDDHAGARLAFQEAFRSWRSEGLTHELTFEAAAGAFGLAFALEGLSKTLADLADSIDDAARG